MVRTLVLVALISIVGCSEVATKREQARRDHYTASHVELIPELKSAIRDGRLRLGMNSEHVRASWGQPAHIYKDGAGLEQWAYQRFPRLPLFEPHAYVYFENDRVINWKSAV